MHQDSFLNNVQIPFAKTHKWFLTQLKDSTVVNLSTPKESSSPLSSNTKKEAVTLPSFQGDLPSSPSPFLAYPVWLNRWNTLIAKYGEKWRIHFLLDRIDDAAWLKIVGCEQDYAGAMKILESFDGDPLKIITVVFLRTVTIDSKI